MAHSRLSTYLNDHLAASVAAVGLAARSCRANRGTSLGEELDRLRVEIEEDRAALRRLMGELGAGMDPVKVTGAWLAEKLGRLKLNGSLVSYSPLSRLEDWSSWLWGSRGSSGCGARSRNERRGRWRQLTSTHSFAGPARR